MTDDLIRAALARAERAGPAVRAAAFLYAARVLAVSDQAAAERALETGIASALALSGDDRQPLLSSAVALAATVSPRRAFDLLPQIAEMMPGSTLQRALHNMMSHGRSAAAIEYLSHPMPGQPYPFDIVMEALGRAADDDARRGLMRAAIGAVREQARSPSPATGVFGRGSRFLFLFAHRWTLLPAEEATEDVREIVRWILAEPDRLTDASAGFAGRQARFTSSREHQLFQILAPLERLDPALAQSLRRECPQFAKAAAQFPGGIEAAIAAAMLAEPFVPPPGFVEQPDVIDVGHRLMPVPEAIATGFAASFNHANSLYAADTASGAQNEAPRECWPSCWEFRKILFKAGEHEGREAEGHLARVPDQDLRLLASIELAAALAGLPQLGGAMSFPRPAGARRRGPPVAEADLPPEVRALIERARTHVPVPFRKPARPTSRDVLVAPSTKGPDDPPTGGAGPDFWVMEGVPLKPVLSRLYDTPIKRIEIPASLDAGRFDLSLVLDGEENAGTLAQLMRAGIEKHFGLSPSREAQRRDVYVLAAPSGIAAEVVSAWAGSSAGPHAESISWTSPTAVEPFTPRTFEHDLARVMDMRLAASMDEPDAAGRLRDLRQFAGPPSSGAALTGISRAVTMAELAEILERGLDRLVVDETGLTERYQIQLETEAKTTGEFLGALARTIGLTVTIAPREVEILVLRRWH